MPHDAASAMDVLDMVLVGHWRHLAQTGHGAGDAVNIGHCEVDAGLLCCRQDVQYGIGRTAHGNVQRHGVFEGRLGGDRARQHRGVILLVIAFAKLDNLATGAQE